MAAWFKDLRKYSLKLTQKALAEQVGIPLGTLRHFEQTGQTSLSNFLKIAGHLRVIDSFTRLARGASMTFDNTQKEKVATPIRRLQLQGQGRRISAGGKTAGDTLAYKLGTVPHISPLLRKLANHGMTTPEEMVAAAVGRGCRHYANMTDWKDIKPIHAPEISNEELAMGLLSPCHPYEPLYIRVGCQLLSAPESNPQRLARLASMDRSLPTLKYIATCGKETEPDNSFWSAILDRLPKTEHPQPEFPKSSIHISRFRAETGITNPFKPSMPKTVWLRPDTR